jgi:hypothetical protein
MYQKGNSTQELWDYFKKELEDSIDENIPQKTVKIKDGNPWITRDIKRPGIVSILLKQFGKFVIKRSSVFDSLVGSSTICTNPWSFRMSVHLWCMVTCWVFAFKH